MTETTTYFYPNQMGRIILLSMEEVMGRTGVHAILKLASLPSLIENYPPDDAELAFPFSTLSNITGMLEQAYGPHGGRGLALRVGRACFNNGVRQYGTQLGITEMAFRLLPLPAKVGTGARMLAQLFNNHTDQRVRIEEVDEKILWHIERCPLCWERHAQEPVCHLAVGVLQEALYWLSGGKVFDVEEKTCIAMGDQTCTIVIDQTPMY
ncbi:MAG: 4-vinyl reductase [Anaerolineales bacterium]|nr:4-vinyl reductase [Anaerolineae bacterium]PWB75148.1 MAG: 4-vinyl reductase [Anaerolineales bacterium]